MRVYISGKIGEEVISEATRQKFVKAEEKLKAEGYEVFNPCDENWQAHLKKRFEIDSKEYQPYIDGGGMPDFYTYCLLRDLMSISVKDAIYMLEDWRKSPGAQSEYRFALATNKIILFATERSARSYLKEKFLDKANRGELPDTFMKMPWDKAMHKFEEENLYKFWLPL